MKYLIAVDIGTTHTKVLLTTTAGKILQEEKAGYPTYHPSPGFSEQDPDEILAGVLSALGNVLQSISDKQNIAAICFSAAMHSVLALNKAGKPLTAAFTWADIRSNEYARKLRLTDTGNRLYNQTGTPVHPMSPLCKIAWIKNELPEIFSNTHKFISVKEYIFYRLFSKFLVDYSIASATGLFNIKELAWNPESLEFAGITAAYLSEPVSPVHAETALNDVYRERFGFLHDIPFFIGSSDGCLAIPGSGAIMPAGAALTIGTSGALRKITDRPLPQPGGNLFNYVLTNNMYVTGGATNNGGNVLKWFSENILDKPFSSNEAFTWFMDCAGKSPAGAKGLIFLPYIYGERAPLWNAAAKGVFFGLHGLHTKDDMMRAILEGICFSLRQVMMAIEEAGSSIEVIYASGGFIQSDLWVQMLCNVLNKKIIVSLAADASAMGAIFLAMHHLGYLKEWKEVKNLVDISGVYYPDENAHQQYLQSYTVFNGLYDKVKDEFSASTVSL